MEYRYYFGEYDDEPFDYEPDCDDVTDFVNRKLESMDRVQLLELIHDLDISKEIDEYFDEELKEHFETEAHRKYMGKLD